MARKELAEAYARYEDWLNHKHQRGDDQERVLQTDEATREDYRGSGAFHAKKGSRFVLKLLGRTTSQSIKSLSCR